MLSTRAQLIKSVKSVDQRGRKLLLDLEATRQNFSTIGLFGEEKEKQLLQ